MCDFIVGRMRDGDLRYIKMYIDGLSSVNEYIYEDDENCLTLLHLAVGLDCPHRESIIEILIKYRADLNCPGKSENVEDVRPLHIAAMWGYDMTVKLLLYHGADASLRDVEGYSPVDYASIFDNYLCISLLLRYGSLNATASAWSAIMDSSLGESRIGDTSFEDDDPILNRSVDPDGDTGYHADRISFKPNHSRLLGECSRRFDQASLDDVNNNGHDERPEVKEKLKILIEETSRQVIDLIESDNDDLDDNNDPYEGLNEADVIRNFQLENRRLRQELRQLGRNPGPITDTTKRIYAKLLTRLTQEDKELVYSPRTKTTTQLNGYSNELNSILTGRFSIKQALKLEKEFINLSGARDYHGPKQFFNYILIDPRITQNLPNQLMDLMSDSDTSGSKLPSPSKIANTTKNGNILNNSRDENKKLDGIMLDSKDKETKAPAENSLGKLNSKFNPKLFDKFLESVFYIGKGQKKRDLMHLYDALADRNSITQKKIDRIRAIWDDGYGVVSLHLFHNITSKEALTREALMIESMDLANLTNLVKGTIQFKLGWNEHKRKQLGALFLSRAYFQLMNEGERQLHKDDLKLKS